MKQITIGLAGHIDHGKTSIVHSLTGKNTDSLKEEIKRGMTIDIGFAHMSKTISLIDVPGHEKFIKNMVSGVSSIDFSILVIAADDGIMPQTIEHFEILELLNIKSGIIVINKIDLVDKEWLDLIELEINEFVKESFLEKSIIIKTSTKTKEGIDQLRDEILKLSQFDYMKNNRGVFRMFLDRVFTMKGFGTIVTGTVSSGEAKIGDELEILPYSKIVKIRGIESHDKKTDKILLGDRAAINIQTKDKLPITRGNHLSTAHYFKNSELIAVKIKKLKKIKNNQRIRFHVGTQESIGRLLFTGKNVKSYYGALIKLEKKIICSFSDRFILRSFSPISTIGGGVILDSTVSGRWKKKSLYVNNLFDADSISERIKIIIEEDVYKVYNLDSLSKKIGFSNSVLENYLEKIDDILYLKNNNVTWIITLSKYKFIKDVIKKILEKKHHDNPDKKGFIKEEINSQINYDLNFLDLILKKLSKEKIIKFENERFSLIGFSITLSNEEKNVSDVIIDILNKEGLATSNIDELSMQIKKDKFFLKRILRIQISNNDLINISNNIIITKKNYLKLLDQVYKFFRENETMNVKEFKNITNTTRKYAVPLLEYLDKNKITYRIDNERKINK